MHGNIGNFLRNELCIDLIGPVTRRKDRPKFNILLKVFSLNPPVQNVYITHYKLMTIEKLVDILCKTDYYHS